MISAGRLDKVLTIQKLTHTTDSGGNRTTTWADVCDVWVQFKSAQAKEFVSAQQVNADVTHVIGMRAQSAADAGLSASHRLKYGTRILNISGTPVDVGERGEETLVKAIEEV